MATENDIMDELAKINLTINNLLNKLMIINFSDNNYDELVLELLNKIDIRQQLLDDILMTLPIEQNEIEKQLKLTYRISDAIYSLKDENKHFFINMTKNRQQISQYTHLNR